MYIGHKDTLLGTHTHTHARNGIMLKQFRKLSIRNGNSVFTQANETIAYCVLCCVLFLCNFSKKKITILNLYE